MSWNVEAYGIYLSITAYITIVVGYKFYQHGFCLLVNLFKGDKQTAQSINTILLVGYYLVNLGYLAISISTWPELPSLLIAIQMLFHKVSLILFVLGLLHFNNLYWIHFLSKRKDFLNFLTH